MKLRFPIEQILSLADSYCNNSPEEVQREHRFFALAEAMAGDDKPALAKSVLIEVARWKSPRSVHHVKTNDEEYVREVSAVALSTPCERLRIESLTLLDGVSWPTASVILHFFHDDQYPILDFRALWSVQEPVPNEYDFDLWWKYVVYCRELADRANVDMRTLDRALWQFSKETQSERK